MASSTSMPTARISENSTTMLTVSPASCRPSTPARNEAGIAMPMNSEARKPSANRMITATRSTPVATEFCRSPSIWRITFDLSCVKVTCTASGHCRCICVTMYFTVSTISIRLAPVRFDTSMVMAGRPLTRVIEIASLKVGLICAMSDERHRRVRRGDQRNLQNVLRPLEQRRHLDREPSGLAFERAGRDQRVERLRDLPERIERDAVAAHLRRVDDDLDRFVARAAQLRREHAGRLLDGVLGRARDAQQRALGHVAGQPDHQHRIEREIDLLHLRLVDVARQVVLGGVDLGTHVGERRLGIETGLELEQHIAAALIGGGAHLLDVTDRLELGLDRPQQQPLGILRADAALGELHEDDRDADVGFRLPSGSSHRRRRPRPAGTPASRSSAVHG